MILFQEKKSSVRSVILGLSSESVIIRFFDVRDAVEFVFELISCFKYDESQIFFVCESVLKELTQILGWLEVPHPSKQKQHQDVLSSDNSGCLKVTLKVDETNDIHASVDSLIVQTNDSFYFYSFLLGKTENLWESFGILRWLEGCGQS